MGPNPTRGNPLLPPQPPSPMQRVMNELNQGMDPRAMAQNILNSNPQASVLLNTLQNQCGSSNPKDFVLNYCAQNGIANNEVMQLASMLGLH